MIPFLIDADSIFNFSGVKGIDIYNEVTTALGSKYYPAGDLLRSLVGDLNLSQVKPYDDALYLEELNYRARIYLVTNLPKLEVKSLLMRYNLDVFVQDVISPDDAKSFMPSREFFTYSARRANSLPGIMNFTTTRINLAIHAKLHGLKVTVLREMINLPRDLSINFKPNLIALAESLVQQRVDSTMGDSALRCS